MFLQKETSHCKNSLALGAQGPKHYVFGDHFYSKNARKLRFQVFLHFDARKYMILSFYLKWTKFTRNFEFFSNYGSPGIRSISVKNDDIICFLTLKWRNTWNLSLLAFFELTGCQKYSAWVSGDPFYAYEG